MNKFKVCEKFISINGEGMKAGQLSVFIRFIGCNLNCSFCDTKWANDKNATFTQMSAEEILDYIKSTKVKNVTITGGEPLLQENISELLKAISLDENLSCEIETNGSINLKPFVEISNKISFTMDYKLEISGMESFMLTENFSLLTKKDTVKFVAGSINDLNKTKQIIEKYNLTSSTNVYISPVFGSIEPKEIVEFMIENNMNDVNMQIQMHKVIWAPDAKGV